MIDMLMNIAILLSLAGIVGIGLVFIMVMRAIGRMERTEISNLSVGRHNDGKRI